MNEYRKQTTGPNLTKIWDWLKWQRLIGLVLIIAGLLLANSFLKPYLYLAFSSKPIEASHPLKSSDNRIFIPGIKLDAPLFENINKLDHGIIITDGRNLGRAGNVILEGHNIARDGPLFSLLYIVEANDKIVIHYKGKRYAYTVLKKKIVKPATRENYVKPTRDNRITLITCYPPTSTAMRLVVIAKPNSRQ